MPSLLVRFHSLNKQDAVGVVKNADGGFEVDSVFAKVGFVFRLVSLEFLRHALTLL